MKKNNVTRTRSYGVDSRNYVLKREILRTFLELDKNKGVLKSQNPYKIGIEATGFEPAASASRTQRSTKLSHASICSKQLVYHTLILGECQEGLSDLFESFV